MKSNYRWIAKSPVIPTGQLHLAVGNPRSEEVLLFRYMVQIYSYKILSKINSEKSTDFILTSHKRKLEVVSRVPCANTRKTPASTQTVIRLTKCDLPFVLTLMLL